jgi:hypothetical protein
MEFVALLEQEFEIMITVHRINRNTVAFHIIQSYIINLCALIIVHSYREINYLC